MADPAHQSRREGSSRELLAVDRAEMSVDPSRGGGARGWGCNDSPDDDDDLGVVVLDANEAARMYRRQSSILPFRTPGGSRTRNLTGEDQLLLVICYYIWPDATPDNVRCFIFNNTDGDHLYSREDIVRRTEELQIFRPPPPNAEPFPAFTPDYLLRCHLYWSQPPPLGVATIRRSQLIDVVEFGVEIARSSKNDADGGRGVGVRVRVHVPGRYPRNVRATVVLAVEAGDPNVSNQFRGSDDKPRVWHRILIQGEATNQIEFSDFVDSVLRDLETNPAPNGCDHNRVITCCDSQEEHTSEFVYDTVEVRPSPNRFSLVPRPLYDSTCGPAEQSFWDAVEEVQRRRAATSEEGGDAAVLDHLQRVLTSGFGWHGAATRRFIECRYEYD